MRIGTIKLALKILIVGLVLAGVAWPESPVAAALRTCRTDPILFFSDGSKLTVTATINTDEANISGVVYTVRVPAGLSLVRTVYTAGGLGGKETVVFIADQAPDIYQTDTVVTTLVQNVQVKAVSSLKPGIFGSASGFSGDHLQISLNQGTEAGSSSWTNPSTVLSGQ